MIAYINGTLIFTTPLVVIVNANGVGYEINFRNDFTTSDLGKNVILFITHKSSEYGDALYGFDTIEEKILFEDLIGIKGIGAKTVYAIVSELKLKTYADLHDVKLDVLTKVSGVGKNTAQKFLLGISTKLKSEFVIENTKDKERITDEFAEVIDVLVGWGIKKSSLVTFISKNYEELSGLGKEKSIQYILKHMK